MHSLQVRRGRLQPCKRRWMAVHSRGISWHEHLPISISRRRARQARTRWPLSRHASIQPASCSSPTAQRDARPGRRRLSSGLRVSSRVSSQATRAVSTATSGWQVSIAFWFPCSIFSSVLFGHLSCSLPISHLFWQISSSGYWSNAIFEQYIFCDFFF
jgi:hypothetical protein